MNESVFQPFTEFDDKVVATVCLWFRHDFGLLSTEHQEQLMHEAREWKHAWDKELKYLSERE